MTQPIKDILESVRKGSIVNCTFLEAFEFLHAHKVRCIKSKIAKSPAEAISLSRTLGFPVVLKLVSREIIHKSDCKGVLLGIQNEREVKQAFRALMKAGKKYTRSQTIDGVAVEHQVSPGFEFIVGGMNDPRFGPVVMVGSGGIFVEAIRDHVFRIAPVTREEAESMIRSLRVHKALTKSEREKRLDMESLIRLVVQVSLIVAENPVSELDLNPVIVHERGLVVVDAKLRLEARIPYLSREISDDALAILSRIFKPRSVAVVGASPELGKIGNSTLKNIVDGGYKGEIYPINPRYDAILGLKCYRTIADIGRPVDLAVIAIPAKAVPPIMKELGDARTAGAIVISSGFAETGNSQLQFELVEKAREAGVRIIGPNTYGIYIPPIDLCAVFTAPFNVKGSVALSSQSGGVGMAMLGYSRSNRLGVSAIIGLGNKSDIDEYDLIEYFGRDEGTSLLALHIEGIRDGRAILEAAKRVAKKKPILALKAGRTLEGMKAASSHTGSLASDPVMVDQLFGSSGILLVQGMNLFFDSIKGLAMIPKPSGEEVLIVTGAGGLGVLLSDACIQNGLRLLKPPQDLLDEAKKFVPPFGTLGNPIDITGGQPPETYEDVLRLVLKDDRVHAIVLGYWQTLIAPPMDFAKGVVKVFSELPRKPLVVSLSGDVEVEKAAEYLEENGIPATCYAPERAVSMLAAKLKWVQRQPC